MRDAGMIAKLQSRIHSLEQQSEALQKQLGDIHNILELLLSMDNKVRMQMQTPDRDKLR
jgi:Asp-tRNA(Asn)/Glu-tRNA(Gln) amidotransferase C subunit